MDTEENLKKILTWAGILALLAFPVYLAFRIRKSREDARYPDEESNIFAAELEE
ncbi:MAG TPA: hypothetical protein VGR15_02945 [Bacteroidota bacterium]|jgi:hypothetical protein|nr:hypothetical protein [Bacteroidota bacterium]